MNERTTKCQSRAKTAYLREFVHIIKRKSFSVERDTTAGLNKDRNRQSGTQCFSFVENATFACYCWKHVEGKLVVTRIRWPPPREFVLAFIYIQQRSLNASWQTPPLEVCRNRDNFWSAGPFMFRSLSNFFNVFPTSTLCLERFKEIDPTSTGCCILSKLSKSYFLHPYTILHFDRETIDRYIFIVESFLTSKGTFKFAANYLGIIRDEVCTL